VIVEISPEPSAAERKAIEAALRAVAETNGFRGGDWWKEGLEENLGVNGGLELLPANGLATP
jgi:hypothetical protein